MINYIKFCGKPSVLFLNKERVIFAICCHLPFLFMLYFDIGLKMVVSLNDQVFGSEINKPHDELGLSISLLLRQ